eukprot:scaffold1297_cov368-Prasinococcus_capsulatus_cf.AAC.3
MRAHGGALLDMAAPRRLPHACRAPRTAACARRGLRSVGLLSVDGLLLPASPPRRGRPPRGPKSAPRGPLLGPKRPRNGALGGRPGGGPVSGREAAAEIQTLTHTVSLIPGCVAKRRQLLRSRRPIRTHFPASLRQGALGAARGVGGRTE